MQGYSKDPPAIILRRIGDRIHWFEELPAIQNWTAIMHTEPAPESCIQSLTCIRIGIIFSEVHAGFATDAGPIVITSPLDRL